VLSSLELLLAAATDSETAERGYVITGDESYLEPYQQAAAVVDGQARRLRELTADNRAQQQRLDSVVPLVTDRLANLRDVIELRRDQGFAAAQSEILTGKGKQFHDRIRRLIGEMEDTETSLLREREHRTNHSSIRAQAVIIGGGVLACGLVGLALFAIRRDFAGRARAERALRDSKDQLELRVRQRTAQLEKAGEVSARLASIVEFSDDAIASKNLEGIITSWNPGAEQVFGYSAQEVVGKPMAMLIPPERASEEPTILARIARGETTDHFETVRVHHRRIQDCPGHHRPQARGSQGASPTGAPQPAAADHPSDRRASGHPEHLPGRDPHARRAATGGFLLRLPVRPGRELPDRHERRPAQRSPGDGARDDRAGSHRDR
ncbi:MAG: PAS domain S-box protein, partial [Gammaproteobacteria bacterium]